ncbi:hypothetical protein DFH94DRAFT_821408 [Russula ochroleuca]|jgi:hypothetical protein|uniref:Yeast cell wall synthesis Kre9/Knh1-like N-terminal domain-containing protein n=1 Tax=Russula ochroleuca TaxID=152965 RepID=A0A9P5JVP5_9AGAM|nr:hypothetical protein DFH94DRAFT_821408 [Russula ochroleuca]
MFPSLVVLSLAALVPFARATVFVTNPVASTSLPAGQQATVAWQDDGTSPTLASFGPASIGLYAGNAQQQTLLQLISASTDVSKANSINWSPDPTAGPNFNNYFIRFTSLSLKDANQTQFNAEAFSAKFTLSGMTGTFNSTVQAEISGSLTPTSGSPAATGATGSGSGVAAHASSTSAPASTVKASAAASTTAANNSKNDAGHMVVPRVLGATGVAAIVFAFFL